MLHDHAIVKISGYEIPLIGVIPGDTLERCEKCQKIFNIAEVELVVDRFLCLTCRQVVRKVDPPTK